MIPGVVNEKLPGTLPEPPTRVAAETVWPYVIATGTVGATVTEVVALLTVTKAVVVAVL